jgi:glycine cleavage system H protein
VIEGQLELVEVEGYALALDRAYQPDDHLWVQQLEDGRVRVGLDSLGVETSGTLAQLAFAPTGTAVARGEPFGSLEAAKFVGPLTAPLSGTVAAHNEAALADPGLVERDPYGDGWLVELAPSALDGELELLRSGDDVRPWFEDELAEYRLRGVIAE